MSFRVRRRLPVWLAAASLVTASGAVDARDYHRPAELEPLHHDNDHEIIFEMEPMHPVKRSVAQPAKPAPQTEQAKKTEPTKPATTAKSAPAIAPTASPAPVAAAKAQPEAPKADAPAKSIEANNSIEANKSTKASAGPTTPVESPKADEAAPSLAAAPSDSSSATQSAPESAVQAAPAPVADASQPTPLPLDQAMNPAASAPQTTPALAQAAADKPTNVPADAAPDVAAAPSAEQAPATSAQAEAQPQKAESAPPASAEQAAPADPAAAFASLMAKAVKGPVEVRIADRATMFLPAGRSFIADDAARDLAKLAGFEWRPAMRGLIAPTGDKLEWLAPVEVLEDGYIKSDVALDADKLLGDFSAGLPEVNAQRTKAGQPPVELSGWLTAPALDDKHRVSACVNVMTLGGDDKYFNCEAWALGRNGAIKVSLAEGGESGERLKGEARALAETIVYDHGKTYEEVDLAADKLAPYSAGDLLTSDVSAKVAPSAPPESESGSTFDWMSAALPLAAIAGLGALLMMRRRASSVAPAPVSASAEGPESSEAAFDSVFAKLLPSLYAKFGKKSQTSSQSPSDAVKPKEAAPASETGGLLSKLPGLRNRSMKEPSAPEIDEADAASALQKLATRMRRSAPEETMPEAVDLSRALRGAKPLPGAAPEDSASPARFVAASAPEAPTAAPNTSPAPKSVQNSAPAQNARPVIELNDEFGLVEPGDPEATSAAMNAREALRQANA